MTGAQQTCEVAVQRAQFQGNIKIQRIEGQRLEESCPIYPSPNNYHVYDTDSNVVGSQEK